jgi:hypothetical protein
MKKTSKKIFGGLMVGMLIAIIGAVIASAQPGFFSELTDEQKEELQEMRDALLEDGATCEELREATRDQLESYGIDIPTRDEMLEKQIEHTQKKLEILERQQELREEGYEWDEIKEIIQEEFELDFPEGQGCNKAFRRGFRNGYHKGLWDCESEE